MDNTIIQTLIEEIEAIIINRVNGEVYYLWNKTTDTLKLTIYADSRNTYTTFIDNISLKLDSGLTAEDIATLILADYTKNILKKFFKKA